MEKTPKQKLLETIDYLDDFQCGHIHDVIRKFSCGLYTDELAKLAGIEGNYDYAMPQPLVDRLQQLNENFSTRFHIYDYRNKSFGEFTNLAEAFVINLQNTLQR